MGLILATPEQMLRKLDTMCHADGLSERQFVQVGHWMAKVGPEFKMEALNSIDQAQMRWMYKRRKK